MAVSTLAEVVICDCDQAMSDGLPDVGPGVSKDHFERLQSTRKLWNHWVIPIWPAAFTQAAILMAGMDLHANARRILCKGDWLNDGV